MGSRADVDPAVQASDRAKREAVAVRLVVGGAPVEHDAHRLRRLTAEVLRRGRARLFQIAQDRVGVVRPRAPEVGVELDAEVRAGQLWPWPAFARAGAVG